MSDYNRNSDALQVHTNVADVALPTVPPTEGVPPETAPDEQTANIDLECATADASCTGENSHSGSVKVDPFPPLKLFGTTQENFGQENNTSFETEATVITEDNTKASFRYDHTLIKFRNGQCLKKNFEHAMAIQFDIDNSGSDTPTEWVSPDEIASRLKQLCFNFWIVASRNHMLTKEKNGVMQAARPRFHVYLPLSAPLCDSDKYVRYCEWCIREFNSDDKVKSKAQKFFGYGDNPNAFIEHWSEGKCIDEVLTETDITTVIASSVHTKKQKSPVTPSDHSPKKDHLSFDWFVELGEWKNHLADLEASGWVFFDKDDVTYFQTPEGDHAPGMHDGNIKDGVAYFFSKVPAPFVEKKGYSIRKLFAGALFGDIGKVGLARFAQQYFSYHVDGQMVKLSEPVIRNPFLKSLLERFERIDFYHIALAKDGNVQKDGKLSQKTYQVIAVSQIIKTAKENDWGLAVNNGFVYVYNGSYWISLDIDEFKSFLAAAAIRLGVPELDARHHNYKGELFKQFVSDGNLPVPQGSNTTLVNLQNGTFEITEDTQGLRTPSPDDFLKHQLSFEYQEDATAPMFDAFRNRVLPEQELQMILAEFIGYVFVFGLKLEKVLILYGTGANGKSVFFEIILALLGYENVSCYKLSSLTSPKSYERAELQNKLLNYASELNGKLEADTFKQLASGEPIEARRIYGHPFMMRRYAKLMFNTNELPREVENTLAFFRRFIIVPFQQTIPEHEQDPQLAQKIINNELPGVFNWVLDGLKRLLQNRKFTESDLVRKQIEEYKLESDSVAMFLADSHYKPSTAEYKSVGEFYNEYKNFCQTDGYRALGKKNFTKRCRALGFEIVKNRGHVIYVEKCFD